MNDSARFPFRPTQLVAALVVSSVATSPCTTGASAFAPLLSTTIVVSQVYGGGGNSGASYKNDFIELFNRGAAAVSVTGWSVQYASSAGSTWAKTDLAGSIPPGGYYLIQEAAGAGGSVNLPPPDAVGSIAMSSSSGKVALVASAALLAGSCPSISPALIDFVGYGSANCFEGAGPAPTLSNTTAALRAGAGCAETDSNAGDFIAGAPAPRNGLTPPAPCVGPTSQPIHAIQGARATSPLAGQVVTTTGVVTGVKANGFFLQSRDEEVDTDPATSEGLFVFTSAAPPAAAAVGNRVSVTGTVQEFVPAQDPASPPQTELAGAPTVAFVSAGNPLPAAAVLTATDTSPEGALEQLERFEGMRVRVDSLTVAAPTGGTVNEANATSSSNGVFFGVITGISRPFREPGVELPDPLPPGSPPNVPRFDANPERIRVNSRALVGAAAVDCASSAVAADLVGPLDYAFRAYTIDPEPAAPPALSGGAAAVPVRLATANELTIATANLERFFDTTDDPDTSDPVLTATAFDRRLAKASLEIRNFMRDPDVIGVEEVENLATLQAIAQRVDADAVAAGAPAPGYQAYLVEGNDTGGIDSGFLVKRSRVAVVDVVQEGAAATYVNPNNGQPEILNDRPPLVLRATLPAAGVPFPLTVIVNHLRSLSGIADPTDGNRVRTKRRAQAEFLANLIQARQAADPTERIVSLGDYNAFAFNDGYVDSLGTIQGTPTPADQVVLASADLVTPDLTNLAEALPADERYSFVFDGNAQALDHILVTANLLPSVNDLEHARVNADFPESLRNDPTRPERLSDHDPLVAYFAVPPNPGEAHDLLAARGPGTSVAFTYAPACGATDHAVYWGTSPLSGGASWTGASCGAGVSGAAAFDPEPPAPGKFVYFVVVGQTVTKEGSYGRTSAGTERPEASGVGGCDRPRDLTGSCP